MYIEMYSHVGKVEQRLRAQYLYLRLSIVLRTVTTLKSSQFHSYEASRQILLSRKTKLIMINVM